MSVQVLLSDSETRWFQMHGRVAPFCRSVPFCCFLVATVPSPRRSEQSACRFHIQRWISVFCFFCFGVCGVAALFRGCGSVSVFGVKVLIFFATGCFVLRVCDFLGEG